MIYCTEGVSILFNFTSILWFTVERVSSYYSIWQVYYDLLYRGCLYIIQFYKYIMIYCSEGVFILFNLTSILWFTVERVSLYFSIGQVHFDLLYRGCLYISQLDKYIMIYCTEGVSIFLNWTSTLWFTVERVSLCYSIWQVHYDLLYRGCLYSIQFDKYIMIYCTEGVSIIFNFTSILWFTVEGVSMYSIQFDKYIRIYCTEGVSMYSIQFDKYIMIYCTEGVSMLFHLASTLGFTVQRVSICFLIRVM